MSQIGVDAKMSLYRTAAPASPVLSLEEARAQLRVTPTFGSSPPSHPEDDLIARCVEAATSELDGVDGWLGRALVTQSWLLSLPEFPAGAIALPLPPLQSVASVTYLDTDGVRQTLTDIASSPAGTDYRVVTQANVGYVAPLYGTTWPNTRADTPDAVQITFTAGFGDPSDVPAVVRQWIAARLGFYYEQREQVIVGAGVLASVIPNYSTILENWRVRGVFQP